MIRKTDNTERWSHKHDDPVEEVWNTYHTLSQIIEARLQAFKALTSMVIRQTSMICGNGTRPIRYAGYIHY